jgi:hypothetical protein
VAKFFKDKKPAKEMIEELYLVTFSRLPAPAELKRTMEYIEQSSNKQKGVEDVLWALLNSREFMFNR